MEIWIVLFGAAKIEYADRSRARKHVLHGLELEVEVLFDGQSSPS